MAQFIIVPIIFGIALLLLSLGKLLGSKHEIHTSCSGEEDCDTCAVSEMEKEAGINDPAGLGNVAQLGNPNRKNRFIDQLDFRPEKFE